MEFCCRWHPYATEYIRQDPVNSNWVNKYHKAQAILPPNRLRCVQAFQRPCAQMWFTPAIIFYKVNVRLFARSLDFLYCSFTLCSVGWLQLRGSEDWYFKFSRGWMFSWMLLLLLQMTSTKKCCSDTTCSQPIWPMLKATLQAISEVCRYQRISQGKLSSSSRMTAKTEKKQHVP